jgi:hypothetical protein
VLLAHERACRAVVQPSGMGNRAPFRFVKAMLGLDAHDGVIDLDPHVPAEIGRVYIHRLHAFATDRDVEATGKNGSAGLAS